MSDNVVRQELELLTGKMINGDITPVVYALLKEGIQNVRTNEPSSSVQCQSSRVSMFESWLRREGKVIAVSPSKKIRELHKGK